MKTLPNGPRSALLINLQSIRDPVGTIERWRTEYGDPMTLPPPPPDKKPVLVTGDPAAIRTLFSAPPENMEQGLVKNFSALFGDSSILSLSGERHAAMRKLLMPPFHGQRMRLYGKQIRDLTLAQTQDFKPGTSFVAQDLMHAISMQTIIQIVFGVTEPERIARVVQLITDFRGSVSMRLVFPLLFPWLRREFFGLGPWAHLQRTIRALRSYLQADITRRRAQKSERTDILSLLLEARYEDGTALDDQTIFEQMHTLLFAGHSTTAVALAWALYFLTQPENKETLARLRAELGALGPDPDLEALVKAPFLEAVCNETLRIRPAAPAVARQLRTPLQLLGYELPAGSIVMASILWAHGNSTIYPQPERFLPERFLSRTYTPYEFLPFGGGNRRCIGAAFALYEMKIVLGTLLVRHAFECVSEQPIRVIQRDILMPSAPIRLRVLPSAPAPPAPSPRAPIEQAARASTVARTAGST